MVKVIFRNTSGTETEVSAPEGNSLMQAATDNLIEGIDADCGGACACATCHVYIDDDWVKKLPGKESTEASMLELVPEYNDNSRLACQITIGPDTDGLIVNLPESQY